MGTLLPLSLVLVFPLCVLLYFAARAFYSLWLKPRRLEKQLRQQGIRGNPYKILYGDMKDQLQSYKEAWSRPMDELNHRIVPRVVPFTHRMVQKYGKMFLIWVGPTPRVVIWDPDMVKEVLSDKSGKFKKPPVNPLIEILARGVSSLEGEEWAKRRKIITPAFHLEKLKVHFIHIHFNSSSVLIDICWCFMEKMSFLNWVTVILNEVLRLYPSVIGLLRHTYKETKLGKFSFPPGVGILLPTMLIHRDTEIWGDDAEEFNPEGFSKGISKACKGDQNAFFPFGWGPRICVGQGFAMIEAKMALAMILQQFSFELSPSYSHAPSTVITLQPQHGAHITLHRL